MDNPDPVINLHGMKRFIGLGLLLISSHLLLAQDNPCDNSVLLKTSKNFNSLYDRDIRNLLFTFTSTCDRDQFKEWRNEILFDIVSRYPNQFIRVMHSGGRTLPVDNILHELTAPVSDDVDVDALIRGIQAAKSNKPVKSRILTSLQQARRSGS